MSYLDDLLKKLNEAELDEKLTTKRAAKKQKLRAKKRAEKKAEKKQAEKQTQEKSKNKGTQLAVYDPKALEQKDFSESFKTLREALKTYIEKYHQQLQQAENNFKSVGTANTEIHEAYSTALITLKTDLETFAKDVYPKYVNFITDVEYEQINNFLNALSEYINTQTEANKLLVTTKEDVEVASNGEIESTEVLSLEDKLLGNKKTSVTNRSKDQATVKNITYKEWLQVVKEKNNAFGQLVDKVGKHFYNFNSFITNAAALIWNPIVSIFKTPIGNDFLKTFMYANPFTAMLFDQKFIKFDLTIPTRKNIETKYDKQGLPKDVDKLDARQARIELYTNKKLINHINNLYNTELTTIKQKADLKNAYEAVHKEIKNVGNEKDIKTKFAELLLIIKKQGNELNWKFQDKTGTTEDEESKIEKQIKTKQEAFEEFITRINNTLNEAIQ